MHKLTTKEFINRSLKKHGNKYDYSNSFYKGADCKISIICKKHGEFHQRAIDHYKKGTGCSKCRADNMIKILTCSLDEFIKKAQKIHKFTYDYSITNYENSNKNVNILCFKHGVFNQSPKDHLQGAGCTKCGIDRRVLIQKYKPNQWSFNVWYEQGKNSKEFESYKLYVIKCTNEIETFIKIGRTFRSIYRRFRSGAIPYSYEVIDTIIHTDGVIICRLEVKLKNLLKPFEYKPKICFNGRKECYSILAEEIILEFIKKEKNVEAGKGVNINTGTHK